MSLWQQASQPGVEGFKLKDSGGGGKVAMLKPYQLAGD